MIKILIVEDDINISKMIQTTVEMDGYTSTTCHNGLEALDLINSGYFDLILLDVMLPEMDGFDIISKKENQTPVIFITAKQDLTDKVTGLKLGADDYIVKPFETTELLARIEVVLRRYIKTDTLLTYGNISLNLNEHICKLKDEYINLTPKEFELIIYFINHQNMVLTRTRLLSAIWGYDFEGESRTVDIHIQQLRKKLDLKADLITLPRLGYKLNGKEDS